MRSHVDGEAIETIPRRGYRFKLPVKRRESIPAAQPKIEYAAPKPQWRAWQAAAAVVLFAGMLGIAGVATFARHRAPAPVAFSAEGARLYQIGRYDWNLRTRDGVTKSMDYFARVIQTDPQDPRGYAALASANAIMGDYAYGNIKPAVYFSRARSYAAKALTIDPNDGEATAVLGLIATEDFMTKSHAKMTQALEELQHAIALDPTSGPAHEWYGVALFQAGHIDEAYAQLEQAASLDPLSVSTAAWLSDAAYLKGRYDEAIAHAREALDLSPERHDVLEIMGIAYEAQGDRTRSIDALRHLQAVCGKCRPEAAALLTEVLARSNRMPEARQELAYALAHKKDVMSDDLAVALAAVGQNRVAVTELQKASGDYVKAELANDPRFAVLRALPQVAAIEKPA
ncbi:MAG: tetratricopeptide repeat protein [Candidatus Eremiobacteraeota bacterium]|nr:tetratricopeptide repeat protein [Candidatus Eremiobacteraeota bacterium]